MELIQFLCYLAIFSDATICKQFAIKNNGTTTTTTPPLPINASNNSNPLARSRLESIKNSYSELNLLSKTNPSDFIFDFDKAVTGVAIGTGGRTVLASVSIQIIEFVFKKENSLYFSLLIFLV
jgi:hypothetical protein